VAIASSLVLDPEFIIADEPVSMLDVSVRAEILALLLELRRARNLAFLFITHDLSLAWVIADRIAVVYLGRIVEIGPADEVIANPRHPYTRSLVSVIPVPEPGGRGDRLLLTGETPSPVSVPSGCRFHPRCWLRERLGNPAACETDDPVLRARDRMCSCRTSGVRRVCVLDSRPGELAQLDPQMIAGQLVRLIREIQPQVIITLAPGGLLAIDDDYAVISQAATAAFRDAGDSSKFEEHFREGLGVFMPQKLYYCVLPQTVVAGWGVTGVAAVPDADVTAVLDVSSYSEAMTKALYCQRHHLVDSIRWLTEERRLEWDAEYYTLVESRLNKKPRREHDLFAGLR